MDNIICDFFGRINKIASLCMTLYKEDKFPEHFRSKYFSIFKRSSTDITFYSNKLNVNMSIRPMEQFELSAFIYTDAAKKVLDFYADMEDYGGQYGVYDEESILSEYLNICKHSNGDYLQIDTEKNVLDYFKNRLSDLELILIHGKIFLIEILEMINENFLELFDDIIKSLENEEWNLDV